MSRPTKADIMMGVAKLIATRSSCVRRGVGCVITNHSMTQVFSIGYNGNYRGGPNGCDSVEPGNCGCLHAEDNALVKLKTEAQGLRLFTTLSPCTACVKRIINQGNITAVHFDESYRDVSPILLLRDAGLKVFHP